jgi:hypothetical protein
VTPFGGLGHFIALFDVLSSMPPIVGLTGDAAVFKLVRDSIRPEDRQAARGADP